MSSKTHNSDYFILVVLGLFTAAVLSLLIALGWIQDDTGAGYRMRTSYSTNVEGTRVCYTLYERLGIPVERLEEPLLENNLKGIGVLFCLNTLVPFHGGEWLALASWVRQGGVLIGPAYLKNVIIDSATIEPTCYHCVSGVLFPPKADADPSGLPPEARTQPLARDVGNVLFRSTELIDLSEKAIKPQSDLDGELDTPAPRALFSDQAGPRIVEYPWGQGRIIVLADSSFLANGFIGKEDNSILAVNLACYAWARAGPNRFAFDEYHMGFGRHRTAWDAFAYMLIHTGPGRAWLIVTLGGILFLIYKARRLGRRQPPPPPRRRSKTEYVHAVGATYRAAGARRLTLELILKAFLRQTTEQVGLPASASYSEIAGALARRCGGKTRQYAALLDACSAAGQGPPLSVSRFNLLLHQLAQVEKELTHGRTKR